MTLVDKIRAFRTIKNFSQENLAQMLGISLTAYAKLERGETEMSYTRLEQIAKAMEVRVVDLLNFGEHGFFYMNNSINHNHNPNSCNHNPNLMFINGVSKETTELLMEVQKLRAEKEGFIKEVAHLKKIIDLLERK
jgi:transcriptional regulator with XRE-family HTH domain